ncbi:MAG: thioredoxin family protein [Planctomycetes bacterium]|nr:thioredoxin family protein [Planctomycetota bacterium]
MDATYLQSKHQAGLPYDQYVATGNPDQQANWKKFHDQVQLTDAQRALVGSFVRKINIIGLSGIWCGDCVQQCPLVARIAQANPDKIDLRFVDRDAHADLQKELRICGGNRVPVFAFCAEDYELVGWYGDRTLSRYRAIAARQLGPSCPMPGAAVPASEVAATLQEWLDEIERAHLLLRLSARLRQKHAD